jgi:hypothetical protein
MVQPEGFVDPKDANKVCKLQRSIYGLKQASQSWNLCFDKVINGFGFVQNTDDSCIYKEMSGSSVSFLVLYVDDILLIGNDVQMLNSVKEYLNNNFSMKYMGEAAYVLGIKIYRDISRRLLALSQSTYLDKVLRRFRMENSKKENLSIVKGMSLSVTQSLATQKKKKSEMSNIPYASAIGSIMYVVQSTRLDVALALSLTIRYHSNPGISHWNVVKGILKNLRNMKDMVLVYGGNEEELSIKGYVDASFDTDPHDSKSQTRYVFMLNGGAVSWESCKQDLVAQCTMDSEYMAASEAANEGVRLRKFVIDLGVFPSMSDAVDILCDNMAAIANTKELRAHSAVKHIL